MLNSVNMDYFLRYRHGYRHGPIDCDVFIKKQMSLIQKWSVKSLWDLKIKIGSQATLVISPWFKLFHYRVIM
jgi:hypothetical protein